MSPAENAARTATINAAESFQRLRTIKKATATVSAEKTEATNPCNRKSGAPVIISRVATKMWYPD